MIRYHLLRSATELDTGTVTGIQRAIASADRAVELSPTIQSRVAPLRRRGLELARATGVTVDVDEALVAWGALTWDDPNCRACQYGLGMAALLVGDSQLAEQALAIVDDLSGDGDQRAADALAAVRESDDG